MTQLTQLAELNISSIFNQRDGKKRKAALRELWAPDGGLWIAGGIYIGYRAVEKAVQILLRSYPEFNFAINGEVDEIPEAARLSWSFGAVGIPRALTGMDVIVASDAKIVAMYRFLDGPEL